jgi:predicted amidophosphoribosyltransferase
VLTTGSTLDECARVLLEGGASQVRAITIARG